MHIEFKNLCNASKHMNMHISNATNQSSWACSPYLCASLVQQFESFYFPQCCFLFVHVHVQPLLLCLNLSQSFSFHIFVHSPKALAFISLYNLSPFVINFHKRCASYWCKELHWGRWFTLESCIFMDITTNVGMPPLLSLEITHVGSLTLIPIGGAPSLMS